MAVREECARNSRDFCDSCPLGPLMERKFSKAIVNQAFSYLSLPGTGVDPVDPADTYDVVDSVVFEGISISASEAGMKETDDNKFARAILVCYSNKFTIII